MIQFVEYLKARLEETSTKAAVIAAIASAAALSSPWSYIMVAASIVLAIVPTRGGHDDA